MIGTSGIVRESSISAYEFSSLVTSGGLPTLERRMRDLNPRDFHLRVFETRALGRYANPPEGSTLSVAITMITPDPSYGAIRTELPQGSFIRNFNIRQKGH